MRAALRDSSWRVRAIAGQTLGELGVDGDAPLLQPLLDDNDVRVAAEAARALTKLAMRCKAEKLRAARGAGEIAWAVARVGDVGGGVRALA